MTKTFKNMAAQGDLLLRKIDKLPEGLSLVDPENGEHVVAHSETGHNHVIKHREDIKLYANDNDPFIAYLVVDNTKTQVEHKRSFDTHETIEIQPGVYEIRRQREYIHEGYRRALD